MSHHDASDALETLFLPFDEGRLQWSDEGALFLRARMGGALQAPARRALVYEQPFKPYADELQRAGMKADDGRDRFPLVLLLPPRQRAESRALMAWALDRLSPGGRVVACAANNEGARTSEADLAQLAGSVETLSKNKHRVFWTRPLHAPADAALAQAWRSLDAIRPIEDGRFCSRPGVFAWDRIDAASALLAAHLPIDLAGRAADLGSGFGYLSYELLQRCPAVTALDVYEADARALDLARRNLAALESPVAIEYFWSDVASGLRRTYDVIVTNPPFHAQSAAERVDMGRRFISVAAQALNPGGQLWLVANRHLPYEGVLGASFGRVRIVTQQSGYKIVQAVRSSNGRSA
jgi:16S rRNA (guanine1207-N2)-methyltransferase